MFDIGGWEFLVIIVIAVIVIGPKDLPGTIRTISGWVRKARELAREFQSGLDDLARETEIDTVKNEIESSVGLNEMRDAGNNIRRDIEQSVDPDGEISSTFRDDTDPYGGRDFGGEEDLDDHDPPPQMTPDELPAKTETAENAAPAEKPPAGAQEKA